MRTPCTLPLDPPLGFYHVNITDKEFHFQFYKRSQYIIEDQREGPYIRKGAFSEFNGL